MSSIKQYLDLFDQNKELINSGSADALNNKRTQARIALEGKQLPDKSVEGYAKTSIDEMFAPDYGVNINRIDIPVDIAASFRCDIPNVSTLLGIVVNDCFRPTTTLLNNLPKGATVMSLAAAAKEHPELVERDYGSVAPINDPCASLNTLLAQNGVLIHVERGVKIDRPIQIVNIFSSPIPLLAARRVLIIAEENAEVQVLFCDHTQDDTQKYLASQVIEVIAKEGAKVGIYDIEESSPLTSRHSMLHARQETSSSLIVNGSTLMAGNTRNEYHISLNGNGAETQLAGMVIGTDKMHADNFSQVTHAAEHCHSDQLFKYVLDDEATGAFEGGITVNDGAKFTNAYQTNRNILASPNARMHSEPKLLIFNDDVKCSHGATTGQLDQNALFYMRSRGIPLAEARTMLMQAFMVDVIDTVRLDGLRDRLRHLVEKRFAGESALCQQCSAVQKCNPETND